MVVLDRIIELDSLLKKIVKYDTDGEIINELIERKIIKLEDILSFAINSNDFTNIYFAGKNVKNINLDKLENKVIEMNNFNNMIKFSNIDNVNVKKFEDKVISLNDFKCLCDFAKNVKNVNMERFEDLVIKTNNLKYILKFAIEVRNANQEKLADVIINSGNTYFMMLFAIHVKKAPVERILDKIIEIGNVDEIITMAFEFNDDYLDKLANAIINTKDAYSICEFAITVEKDLTKEMALKLADAVMEYGNNMDIHYFIANIRKAPVDILNEKIKENERNLKLKEFKKKVRQKLRIKAS